MSNSSSGRRSKLGEGTFNNLQEFAEKLSGQRMYADFQIIKKDGSASEWYRIAPTDYTTLNNDVVASRSLYKINDLPESYRQEAGVATGYTFMENPAPLLNMIPYKNRGLGERYKSAFESAIISRTKINASDIASIKVKNAVERKKTNFDKYNLKFYTKRDAILQKIRSEYFEAKWAGDTARAAKLLQRDKKVSVMKGKPSYKYEKIRF